MAVFAQAGLPSRSLRSKRRLVGGDDVSEPAKNKELGRRCGRKAHFEPQRILSDVPAPVNATEQRIAAEQAWAAETLPPNTLPTVAAALDRDREARIRLGLPLINHARAARADEAEEGA